MLYFILQTGYELHGLKNIPEGPALLIYYHAAIPSDLMFFLARYFILKRRLCSSVTDHVVHKIPGKILLLEIVACFHIYETVLFFVLMHSVSKIPARCID